MEDELKRKVIKRTREERKALCEQWKASGTSKREFCRENNIPTASFFSWCSKLWTEPKKHATNLLPIKVINSPLVKSKNEVTQTEIELTVCEGGTTIRFKLPIKNLVTFIQELSHAVTTIR